MVKLVEARGLAHEYPGGVRALAGVDFSIAVGELAVVLGPNGSGKSTLLKLLSGLIPCRAGRIEIRGRELARFSIRERARHVAVVPQFLPALPSLSVVDFVLGGRYAHRVGWRHSLTRDREVVERSLAACDALDLASRAMDELSGGQRQRVLLARALAQEAEILLVDEPTNSLDPEHQVRVFALLAELAREGRGACVVTHDLNLAAQFATRLTLLDAGRVAAEGTIESVLRPETLAPVYGEHLYYGRFDDQGRAGGPFVLPRLRRS